MPGYKRSEKYAPSITTEVDTMEKRFLFPNVTLVQLIIVTLIVFTATRYKNFNKPTLAIMTIGLALLHLYDHMFLVKRGGEKFFLDKREGYCSACKM
jgi:hypothetical protein